MWSAVNEIIYAQSKFSWQTKQRGISGIAVKAVPCQTYSITGKALSFVHSEDSGRSVLQTDNTIILKCRHCVVHAERRYQVRDMSCKHAGGDNRII